MADNARIGGVNAIDIGIDIAAIRLQRRRDVMIIAPRSV